MARRRRRGSGRRSCKRWCGQAPRPDAWLLLGRRRIDIRCFPAISEIRCTRRHRISIGLLPLRHDIDAVGGGDLLIAGRKAGGFQRHEGLVGRQCIDLPVLPLEGAIGPRPGSLAYKGKGGAGVEQVAVIGPGDGPAPPPATPGEQCSLAPRGHQSLGLCSGRRSQ